MRGKDWEFLSFAVQFGILILCLILGFDFWLSGLENKNQRKNLEENRKKLSRLAVRCDSEVYAHSRLLSLSRKLSRFEKFSFFLERFKNLWNMNVQVYFFDFSGKCVDSWPSDVPSKKFFEKLFKCLIMPPCPELEVMRKELDPKISFLFGEGKKLFSLQSGNKAPVEILFRKEDGLLVWNRNEKGGLIVILEKIPSDKEIFQKIWKWDSQKNSVPPISGFGYRGEGKFFRSGDLRDEYAEQLFSSLEKSSERQIEVGGFEWLFLETGSGKVVYGAFPVFRENLRFWRQTARLGGLFLFFLGCFVLRIWGKKHTIPLRRLLPGLFAISASIPLLGIALGSVDLLDNYREVLGSRIRSNGESLLRNLVSNFYEHLDSLSKILDSRLDKVSSFSLDLALQLHREGLLDIIQARDENIKLVFSYPEGPCGRSEAFMKPLVLLGIENYYPGRLKGKKISRDIFAEGIIRSDDMGFASTLNRPGQFQMVQLGRKKLLVFFKFYKSGPLTFVETQLSVLKGLEAFLNKQARVKKAFEGGEFRLFAIDTKSCRWLIPPRARLRGEILSAALAGKTFGRPEFALISNQEQPGVVICLPCPSLENVSLVLFYPLSHLGERIMGILRGLLTVGVFFLILLFVISRVLSNQLIHPVNSLSLGLEALSHRDFGFQILDQREDEFGKLFSAFNNMMEEAKDLNLARIVQEGLIPSTFPEVPGYDIHGKVVLASDLGGDVLDSFLLPNGKFCFIVGDIVGHGIGAALMMAFARAVSFHESQKADFSPEKLAYDIDALLREQLNFQLFMGLICGLLDPQTHRLEILVTGMPFPLMLKKGKSQWIGHPSLPLGIGKSRKRVFANSIQFSPGDQLICYSDGCVEAMNIKGEMLGYEGFSEMLINSGGNSTQIVDNMLKKVQAWRNQKITDDLTLFVISQNQEENEKSRE
ncbi:MAG: SpoIIE family protein phosphatase [Candidatus Riflebacteria bacterium]|nr:SpoIIE family protein phosphatase [Candidatus Riflebacteria bacterium]